MAAIYATVAQVIAQLGVVDKDGNRPTLDGDSIPTSTEITEIIEDAENDIEEFCNAAWREVTVTDEYHSTPTIHHRRFRFGIQIQVRHQPLRSFTKIEVWDGDVWNDIVATGTLGDGPGDGTYFINLKEGILYLHSDYPTAYYENNIRLNYTWGKADFPKAIRRATIFLAAAYVIISGYDWVNDLIGSAETSDYQTKAEYWEKKAWEIAGRFHIPIQIPQF